MRDLRSPRVIWFKGWLFAIAALLAAVLLWREQPTLKVALLLGVCVWCSCRFYDFAFRVAEQHGDPRFRFRGMGSFLRYLIHGASR